MPRKILDKELFEKEQDKDSDRKDYKVPEEKLIDSELMNILIGHYLEERDKKKPLKPNGFESRVERLESLIKELGDKFQPQLLIDSLTVMLMDVSDSIDYPRSEYLTAVIQVLYNMGLSDKFVINISDWPEMEYNYAGYFLKGREKNPLTLRLYGNFMGCGHWAENCNFIVHDRVTWTGQGAENCRFTFHDYVKRCGDWAKDCEFIFYKKVYDFGAGAENSTFSLMPGAEMEEYQGEESEGNVLRKMNDKG